MSNVVNQSPFLRTSRSFPREAEKLTIEVDKSYIDIANAVNSRTIGIFPTGRPALTGESWFLNVNQRQQSFRQVYNITSYASFNHGINFDEVSAFTVIRAVGFDGTNYFPIPFLSSVNIFVTPTQVVLQTTSPPALVSGIVILEWLSQV
jgi:hypothetical protein